MAYQFRGKINMASALSKSKGGGFEPDPNRFNYKMVDGKFVATVALLPAPDNEHGFVKTAWHKFKDHSGRDINLACPKMAGLPCPICSYVNALYAKGDEASKKIGQKYLASKNMFANVEVKINSYAPDTVGRVMIMRYTKEINTIITEAMTGDVKNGIQPVNVFDYESGTHLIFKAIAKGDYPTYAQSKFERCEPMTQEHAIALDQQLHPLEPIVEDSRSKIKSLDVIISTFRKATGVDLSDYVDGYVPTEESNTTSDGSEFAGGEEGEGQDDAGGSTNTTEVVEASTQATTEAPSTKATTKATKASTQATTKATTPPTSSKKDAGFWGDFDKD